MKPKISDMAPTLQLKFAAFSAHMAEAGIPFALNCVLRTQNEQEALHAQGRWPLADVNVLRAKAKMYLLQSDKENIVVTWTMQSKHFPSTDGKAKAFDIVILKADAKPTWDLKYSGNKSLEPDYLEAAKIGKTVGLVPGAYWASPDYPHYQLENA